MEVNKYAQIFETLGKGKESDKYYVYGLFDKKDKEHPFYIGKGQDSRVTAHKKETDFIANLIKENRDDIIRNIQKDNKLTDSQKNAIIENITNEATRTIENSTSKKQKTIRSLDDDLQMVIFKWGLTEHEAFMCESALINAYNYTLPDESKLTNIVNGHMSKKEKENISKETKARSLLEFYEDCVISNEISLEHFNKNIRIINISKTYPQCKELGFPESDFKRALYDSIRGCWEITEDKRNDNKDNEGNRINYVIGIYNSRIVGIYRVDKWKQRINAINFGENGNETFSLDFPSYPPQTRELEKIAMRISNQFNANIFNKTQITEAFNKYIEKYIIRDNKKYSKKPSEELKKELKEKFMDDNPENFKIEDNDIIFYHKYGNEITQRSFEDWKENFDKRFYFGDNETINDNIKLEDIITFSETFKNNFPELNKDDIWEKIKFWTITENDEPIKTQRCRDI